MKNLFFICVLLLAISSLTFKKIKPLIPSVSKKTYIHFTLDSSTYSFSSLIGPACGGKNKHCGHLLTTWSNSRGEPNGSSFQLNVALPKDPLLMGSYSINKKHKVTSNAHEYSTFCPLLFWISYRPDKNAEFGYVSMDDNDTTQQYVVYTKIEKGGSIPEFRIKDTYYLTGYFQCRVQENSASVPKFMKGNFRMRVCFDMDIE